MNYDKGNETQRPRRAQRFAEKESPNFDFLLVNILPNLDAITML
jgi:hypothetical protein